MDQPSLQTSTEVWEFLLLHGGIDLKTYDLDIVNEMRGNLNIPLSKGKNNFRQDLIIHGVDVEHLIVAFFTAVAPFSSMMSDLLVQFEKSGAFKTTHNLKIKFDFNIKSTALEFDLEHFRSWQIQFIHALRPIYMYEVTSHILFQLYMDICTFLDVTGRNWNPNHQEVKRWINDYDSGFLPKYIVKFQPVGNEGFDSKFSILCDIWNQVWADCHYYNITRTTNVQIGKDADDYALYLLELLSDGWLKNFLFVLEAIHNKALAKIEDIDAEWLVQEQPKEWRQKFLLEAIQFMSSLLERIPRTLRNKSMLTRELLSFLELPVWKKRYDLYAAWISTQIMIAMDPNMTYIHENGVVTFSFSRNHLATSRKYEPTLELWSEVRSPLANPLGKSRQNSIQPDYSLLSDIGDAERSTLLVVECKQYRRAVSKSFADALNDYARGRPNAKVLIVNYGKGSSDIASRIDPQFYSRVKVIHEMCPNSSAAIQEFQDYLKKTINQACSESYQSTIMNSPEQVTTPLPLKVMLTWGEKPYDLDLHLKIVTRDTDSIVNIDYLNKGKSEDSPWVALERDEQKGFGPEEMLVFQWIPGGVYHFSVNNFSKTPSIAQSGAKVSVFVYGYPSIEISCPVEGSGESWEVFSFDSVKSQLRIYNRLGS
ncbi:hypothetical protein [Paenibacillus mesotrionivorans]|uniref:Uncharacterized protein n=1 Tax=Paenibacillus mesotrionivorans TaxID=3160968 RepID=A0ACC7P3K0_9BACL